MPYNFNTDVVGVPPITDVSSTAKCVIGTRVKAYDPLYGQGEFIYLPGVASCVAGSVAAYDEQSVAGVFTAPVLTVAATRGPVAVAMAAITAGNFGWWQISGAAVVKSNTVADNALVYSTATPGEVDDAVVAGSKIDGMNFKAASGTPAAGFAIVQMDRAAMNGNG